MATQTNTTPGKNYAHLTAELLMVWPYMPDHHMRLLPLILKHMPNSTPRQKTLAAEVGVHRQTINDTIGQLSKAGMLIVEKRVESSGQQKSSRYHPADLSKPEQREQVINWYRQHYPDTSAAKRDSAANRDTGVAKRDKGVSPLRHDTPVSPLGHDTPCRPLDTTPSNYKGNPKYQSASINRPVAGERATPATSASPTLPLGHGLSDQAEGTQGQLPAQVTTEGSATASWVRSEDFEDIAGQGYDEDEAGTAGEPTTDDQRQKQVLQPAAAAPVENTTVVDEPVTAAVASEGTKAAADTTPAKQARKQRFGRRAALTEDQQAAATASVDAITRWLRFDIKAFDVTANLDATITPFDWLTDKTPAGDFDTKAWSINQMAGLFWALVSQYRAERGLALTLPNWGRLCSHVTSLDRRTPRGRLIELLIGTVKHFDQVREWSRQTLRLDEGTLADSRFMGAYENLEIEQARERA